MAVAQIPKISYQAVLRDANNRLVTNMPVTVAVTITYGSDSYSETGLTTTTNANGLFSIEIGSVSGYEAIKWDNATIKTVVTFGDNTIENTTPVTAVPYALNAKSAADLDPNGTLLTAVYDKIQDDSTTLHGALKDTANALRNAIPIVPAQVNADWKATSGAEEILNKPAINDDTLSITLPDGTKIIYTANQPGNTEVNIVYPGISVQELLEVVEAMTPEQKAALRDSLGISEPTTFTCGVSKIADVDGHQYETVLIGEQCWTKTNLRTTKFRNGNAIPEDIDPEQSTSASFSRASSAVVLSEIPTYTDSTFGFYYNWYAATDTGDSKLCPEGWHVPNDGDWMVLSSYLRANYACGNNLSNNAKAMADSLLWGDYNVDCSVGKDQENNNASGFSAVPAGYLFYGEYSPIMNGTVAYFWTAMPSEGDFAKYYVVSRYLAELNNYNNPKSQLLSVRCIMDDTITIVKPVVTTDSTSAVTTMSAKLHGTIINPNGIVFVKKGFEWKLSSKSYYNVKDVTGTELITTLENLIPDTQYTFKAFINYDGKTYYGDELTFKTLIKPTVTTGNATNIAMTSATISGTISNSDQVTLTEKGFVWKKSHGVYEYDTVKFTGGDAMSHTFTDLVPNTKYDYKAFVQFDGKTVYGEELSFTTPNHQEVACGTMTDADGNLYQTVKVGSQCWTKTNLRTTKYRDGSTISNQIGTTVPAYYRLNDMDKDTNVIVQQTASPDSIFGFYYNGYSTVGNKLCPAGWHVPSYDDWSDLITYLKAHPEYWCDNDNSNLAKAVASRNFWFNVVTPPITYTLNHDAVARPCSPQYQDPDYLNDASYFCAIPAGAWYDNLGGNIDTVTGLGGREFDPGKDAHFWSSTTQPNSDSTGYLFRLGMVTYDVVALAYDALKYGRSVRCLRDEPVPDPLTFSCGTSQMIDASGNHYETVQIGEQCWTKTNLRTMHYRDGSAIPENQDASLATASFYRPSTNDAVTEHYTDSIYGMYYNAYAAADAGLCPTGWHVPTKAEWEQLTTYMSSQSAYVCGDYSTDYIASALAGTHKYKYVDPTDQTEVTVYAWKNENKGCAVGSDRGNNNASGFSAFPAGYWENSFMGYSLSARFWTSTPDNNQVWVSSLTYSEEMVSVYKEDKENGLSVRCVKD
jgi:uncharacterized protein (TIGR02145 family)